MKKQVLVIHGGTTFEGYSEYEDSIFNKNIDLERIRFFADWKSGLQSNLGGEFDVFNPNMPAKDNAKYEHWKIIFEKIVDKLDNDLILVGHSLGGIFLAKYLSENNLGKKVIQLHLVAAPFDNDELGESLGDFKINKDLLYKIEAQSDNTFIYHSSDDPIVPFSHSQKYLSHINNSKMCELHDRMHIWQENFPELVENITKFQELK